MTDPQKPIALSPVLDAIATWGLEFGPDTLVAPSTG
jgi:hypothetical protein